MMTQNRNKPVKLTGRNSHTIHSTSSTSNMNGTASTAFASPDASFSPAAVGLRLPWRLLLLLLLAILAPSSASWI